MQKFFLSCCICFLLICNTRAQVGIGTPAPDASAALDVTSNTSGMLVPRMDSAARKIIASPADGLMVYDTDTKGFWFYRSTTGWTSITDATNSTAGKVGFSAVLTSSQTIPNYTYTSLVPYSRLYDYSNNFDLATGIFTAPTAGLYHFTISVEVPLNATINNICIIECLINGFDATGGTKTIFLPPYNAAFTESVSFSYDAQLGAADQFSYKFLQRTGDVQTIHGGLGNTATSFSGFKVF